MEVRGVSPFPFVPFPWILIRQINVRLLLLPENQTTQGKPEERRTCKNINQEVEKKQPLLSPKSNTPASTSMKSRGTETPSSGNCHDQGPRRPLPSSHYARSNMRAFKPPPDQEEERTRGHSPDLLSPHIAHPHVIFLLSFFLISSFGLKKGRKTETGYFARIGPRLDESWPEAGNDHPLGTFFRVALRLKIYLQALIHIEILT